MLEFEGLGGLRLSKDLQTWNPYEGPGKTITCCAFIETLTLDSEHDPLEVTCYVSGQNAPPLLQKLATPITNALFRFRPYIISCERNVCYDAFRLEGAQTARGDLWKNNGEFQANVDRQGTRKAVDAKLHKFEFKAMPHFGHTTAFHWAISPTQKGVWHWEVEDD